VYSTNIAKGQVVESTSGGASCDLRRVEEVGLLLQRHIKKAREESSTMPWRPAVVFLHSDIVQTPALLHDFLKVLISGKGNDPSQRSKRYAGSVAPDILLRSFQRTVDNVKAPETSYTQCIL